MLRCSGCEKGAVSEVYANHSTVHRFMVDFYPVSIGREKLPESTPEDLKAEFVEAEGCMAFKFNRAASALFRSVLEKTLKQNGYTQGSLQKKLKMLRWRKIEYKEVELAQKYAQRIIEDFYSDRDAVKKTLPSERRTAADEEDNEEVDIVH